MAAVGVIDDQIVVAFHNVRKEKFLNALRFEPPAISIEAPRSYLARQAFFTTSPVCDGHVCRWRPAMWIQSAGRSALTTLSECVDALLACTFQEGQRRWLQGWPDYKNVMVAKAGFEPATFGL